MSAEQLVIEELAQFIDDPVALVYYAFPWGEEGTDLAHATGPEEWQLELLVKVRDGLLSLQEALRFARASGHGIGKSALVSWLVLWSMCRPDTRGIVTASTETQLRTRTWPELAKWYRLFIGRHLFKMTATAIFSADEEHEKTWRMDSIPWSEHNPTAFAGMHNFGKRLVIIFDEASEIADIIWETIDGALTDANTQILWFTFGNPTSNKFRFRQCFPGGKFAHRWDSKSIDARTVSITNKAYLDELIHDRGDDDDLVRIRVYGKFPKAEVAGFISEDLVDGAINRELHEPLPSDPFIVGVDVARYGDDASVLFFRKGRDARSIPPESHRGRDTMFLAGRVAEIYYSYHPDAIFIDEGGVGSGVVDRCNQLGVPVIGVQFGARADRIVPDDESTKFANKRAEMWGFLRHWLRGGCLPEHDGLRHELTAPLYTFRADDSILLESKKDMKRRGLGSPDVADAAALTFAFPVVPKGFANTRSTNYQSHKSEYDPIELEAA